MSYKTLTEKAFENTSEKEEIQETFIFSFSNHASYPSRTKIDILAWTL